MLHIHRAERADRLVEALAGILSTPLEDPLATEVVAVPTRGVERWLSQSLSHVLGATSGGDGVCANVAFPSPASLITAAVAQATGIEPASDPWLPERSLWPLLEAVEESLGEPWLAPLAAHLGARERQATDGRTVEPGEDRGRQDRRLAAVRHLADLYDRYALHRPAMLRAWAEGRDVGGDQAPLARDVAWQAELWRRLRARLEAPSFAERLADACRRLAENPGAVDLPARFSIFGLTRLAASAVEVLGALATQRDVHLHLLHPSPALWREIAALDHVRGIVPRREDLTEGTARNPLLGTWGRDARELQLVLSGAARARDHHIDAEEDDRAEPTLLERLQADVRANRAPVGEPLTGDADRRPLLDPSDRSVAVHSCHGRGRQVEVLRDAVLHLLADDPTLEPRDIIVMCPDIEAFAPLIHATFAAGEQTDELPAADADGRRLPDLQVRLADRSLRQTNPLLGGLSALLELAAGRATASEVLDFAGREPVRRRFGFDDDDLARCERWVAETGIRWGLDREQRAPTRVTLEDGTWRRGLDRVLVGVAMAEDDQRLYSGVLPLDDVHSGDIDLAGRLAELLDRLSAALRALSRPQPLADWLQAIEAACDALMATSPETSWQRAELGRLLSDVRDEARAGAADFDAALSLAEIRDLLAERLRGRATTAGFRTGHMTVCTLLPMRSVPHRVVCLLGLDDGVFPRRVTPDGDDLIGRTPHVGDHDPRSEDRQLLLDALLAAREHLVITYEGHDERTNAPRPPAVPIGELLDVVDATVRTADGRRAREHILVHHPLQPFDPRNFRPGLTADPRPWGFDPTALEGALALTGQRHQQGDFLREPLPAPTEEAVELDELVRFVQHPVRAFLRGRLGVSLYEDDEEPSDELPVELDRLEEWALGQRLLEARLAGADPASIQAAELARGTLPPGNLALPVLRRIGPLVDQIAAAAAEVLDEPAPTEAHEVLVELGPGRTLVGTVGGVHGDVLRATTYSRVAPKHRLVAWVRLLALTASHPDRAWRAATVGRGARPGSVAIASLPPLGSDPPARAERARALLRDLVDLRDRGLREPLPLYCKTSAAWADARLRGRGRSSHAAAQNEWESDWNRHGEDAEPEHRLVLGGTVSFGTLLENPVRADETGPGWPADESTRFGRYALRLWAPLLEVEEVRQR